MPTGAAPRSQQPRWPPISNWRLVNAGKCGQPTCLSCPSMIFSSLNDFARCSRSAMVPSRDAMRPRSSRHNLRMNGFRVLTLSSDASKRDARMLELDELRDLLEGRRGNPPVEKTDIETAIQALLAHQIVYPDTSLLRRDVYDLIRRHSTFFERYFGAMGVGIVIEPPTGMIALVDRKSV